MVFIQGQRIKETVMWCKLMKKQRGGEQKRVEKNDEVNTIVIVCLCVCVRVCVCSCVCLGLVRRDKQMNVKQK